MSSKHTENISKANEEIQKNIDSRNDNYRFNYHFSPIVGWINDPNGLIYYKNQYHVFYQYHPYSASWGPMHWGHAISDDLFNWEHLPVALAPSENYDSAGCFSGSAVELDGEIVLIYTGASIDDMQVQCLAKSSDGITYLKHDKNPVIPKYPVDGSKDFRDPKVWKHEDKWYAAIGSAKEGKGKVLIYKSSNLVSWEYLGTALENDGQDECVWECPNIISVNKKHLMILSSISKSGTEDESIYFIGDMDYNTGQFNPEHKSKLDYGTDFYAPQIFYGNLDRIIMIGWMSSWRGERVTQKYGWEGAFTLPRELKIIDNKLYCMPIKELKSLRRNHSIYSNIEVESSYKISEPFNNSIEILALFGDENKSDGHGGMNIYFSDSEKISIVYNIHIGLLSVDFDVNNKSFYKEFDISQLLFDDVTFNVFIDVCSIEIFINNGAMVITERIYPNNTNYQVELELISFKEITRITRIDVWDLHK